MLTAVLVLATIAAASAIPAEVVSRPCIPGQPGIRVNVSGVRDRVGALRMEVYPANQNDFLQDGTTLLKAGKIYLWTVVPVPEGAASLCLGVPQSGRYAVVVIHRRNATRPGFSIFNDGVAVSGRKNIGRGKPKLAQAEIVVADNVATVDAPMQYLRGIGGFRP